MNSKTIMLVEDSDFDRHLIKVMLQKKFSFTIIEEKSGEAAIEKIEKEKIDLVLLDFMMTGMDGYQTLTEIRKKHNAIELPVIMVTAKSESADIIQCLQAGANDYITKPINLEVAAMRIRTHLTLLMLSEEMTKLREVAAASALITTYNHEINNALAITLSYLQGSDLHGLANREKIESSIWRAVNIIKKISEIAEKNELEFQNYSNESKMIKLKGE